MSSALPFLDLTATEFSTRSETVLAARNAHWCAQTPHGLAVLRHRQAGTILRDKRFRQGSHAWPDTIGLVGHFAEFWRRSIISMEGKQHVGLRMLAQKALSEEAIGKLEPTFTTSAEALCHALRKKDGFDAVFDFTEPFAGQAIAALLGVPKETAGSIAQDASCLGFAMGPEAKSYEGEVNAAVARLSALAERLLDAPPPGSFVERLVSGPHMDRQSLIDLIVIAIFGGVDTTRAQLAFAAHLFAQHPAQWTWLRANPEAVMQAIDEVIRIRPTTTWATREAVEDTTIDDVTIPKGTTVHILVHSTSTDPESGHDGNFNIRVRRKSHFGFGGGAHHCLGHLVARTDMAAALRVWLANWTSIELAGAPKFLPDSGNTSPLSMPIQPQWTG